MKKKKANSARNKKIIIAVAVVVVLIAILVLLSLRPVKNYSEKYAGTNLDVEVKGMERTGTYKQYVLKHPDAAKPNSTIDINLSNYTAIGEVSNYTGEKAVAPPRGMSQSDSPTCRQSAQACGASRVPASLRLRGKFPA